MAASPSITITRGGNIYSPKNKDVVYTTDKTDNITSPSISETGHLHNIHHVNQRRDRNSERERKHIQARYHNDSIARQTADTRDNRRRCKSEPYRHDTNMDNRSRGVYDKVQKQKRSRARSAPARYAEFKDTGSDRIKTGSHQSNTSNSSSNDSQFSVSIYDESKLTDTNSLPPNWIAIEDPASGDTYYANEVTKESTWNKPVMPDIPRQSLQDETENENSKDDLLDRRYDHRPKQDVPSEGKINMSNLAHHLETIQESGSALTREELKHLHVRHHSEIISKIPGINLFIRPFEELTTSKNEKMLSEMESRIMDRLEGMADMERRIMNRLDGIDKRLDVIESTLKEEGNL